jgi:flagellar basal body-associated protein FliL
MSASAPKKGSRAVRILGIITLIGIIVAVARIVLRVFNEKGSEPEDGHNGI